MLRLQSYWGRYGLAVGGSLVVALLYFISHSLGLMSDLRYFGFAFVVLVSALLGGFGPGLVATGLGALFSAYLLLPPIFSLEVASDERRALLILFIAEGTLLSAIGTIIREARTADLPASWKEHYVSAVLFVSTATGLKFLVLRNTQQEFPFTFFYAAIAASAWAGGLSAGLAATLLSVVSARFFFLHPAYSFAVDSGPAVARVLLFALEGTILAYFGAKQVAVRRLANEAISRVSHFAKRLHESAQDTRALRTICGDAIWELNLASQGEADSKWVEKPAESAAAIDFAGWLQQVHPKDRFHAMASLRSALEQGRTEWFYEYRRRRPGRGYVHVSDHAYIIRDDEWNPVRVVARSADQAELRHTSLGLESDGPYRAFFENNPDAILLADKALRIVDANDSACDLLGYRRAELKNFNVESAFEDRKRGLVMDMLLNLDYEDHPSITFEEECQRADGEVFRAKITAALISQGEADVVDRMITIREIPEGTG